MTLHHRICSQAQEAVKKGESTVASSNIIEPEIKYVAEVQEVVDLVRDWALDAHQAISSKNKSAGRRARTALIAIRDKVTPLRKKILDCMQDR